jgi:NAD-dependent dihydropyrimidine dehydrogenase PreA subunit
MVGKAKILVFLSVFLLFASGRWLNLFIFNNVSFSLSVQWSIFYGMLIAFIFYFVADLVMARGLLNIKIRIIIIISFYMIAVLFVNRLLSIEEERMFIFESILTVILLFVLLGIDFVFEQKEDFLFNKTNNLPLRYTRAQPLKTFLESVFRLLPNPEPIGLYKIGKPNKNSLVIVTGNYDLTVRRVVKHLKDIDCWLLVCDSRGVNIWCSSLADHFNTDKVINAIKLLKLGEKVGYRKLLLPQLCASNVSPKKIKNETGFTCDFGPVYIKNLKKYLLDPKNRQIRRVTFNLGERLEMSFATIVIPSIFLFFIFNFIGLKNLFIILPAIYGLSFVNAAVFPYRLVKNIRLWAIFFGFIVFLFNFLIFTVIFKLNFLIYNITISIAMVYLVNEFEGWSPLVKFNLFSSYDKVRIKIEENICIGCERCVEVCPKGVYEIINRKSKVVALKECASCKSCFYQCPVGAIKHSADINNCAF